MLLKILLIAIGGAAGAVARYALHSAAQRIAGPAFPVGTLIVNLLGCLAIGAVMAWLLSPDGARLREEYKLAILVGVLGGFTTFSTYAWDTFVLLEANRRAAALTNLLLSTILGLVCVWIGYRIAARMI